MSDLEKVFAYANQFCKDRPIQLRWEGAGDCLHPKVLLGKLKDMNYLGTSDKVKFFATLNLYESDTSSIFTEAMDNMFEVLGEGTPEQDWCLWTNVDVTRTSRLLDTQQTADLMFVRNIMLTDEKGNSLTQLGDPLANLHETAIRRRANSINEGGELRIGMSGTPGLYIEKSKDRPKSSVEKLFYKSRNLFKGGRESGLTPPNPNAAAKSDVDKSVDIMKNDGSSLGKKPTYYLTFVKPNHSPTGVIK